MKRNTIAVAIIVVAFAAAYFWWLKSVPAQLKPAARTTAATSGSLVHPSLPSVPTQMPVVVTLSHSPSASSANIAKTDANSDPRNQAVYDAIDERINQIQTGTTPMPIGNKLPPEILARIKANVDATYRQDSLARGQDPDTAQQKRIDMLNALKNQAPTYNESGNTATFKNPYPGGDDITFVERDGTWSIYNAYLPQK